MVLGVTSEKFILEIFRLPYSHFGSVCKYAKKIFFLNLATILNLEKLPLEIFRLYGTKAAIPSGVVLNRLERTLINSN